MSPTAGISPAGEVSPGGAGTDQPRPEQHPRDLCPARDGDDAWPEGLGTGTIRANRSTSPTTAECALDELWRGELDLELAELDQLREHQHGDPPETDRRWRARTSACNCLQTIPGVGRKTAEVVVAYLDDPHRFRNARQVSSYAGLVPRRYQSGEMDRHGQIHKRGPRQLRSALVEAAWLMLRYNPWAKSVYERISGGQKTRRKKAIVAVARKLLVRCWVMLLRKEPWNPETLTRQPPGLPLLVLRHRYGLDLE